MEPALGLQGAADFAGPGIPNRFEGLSLRAQHFFQHLWPGDVGAEGQSFLCSPGKVPAFAPLPDGLHQPAPGRCWQRKSPGSGDLLVFYRSPEMYGGWEMKWPLISQALKLAATMSLLGIWIMRNQSAGLCRRTQSILSHRPSFSNFVFLFFFLSLRGGSLTLYLLLPKQRKARVFGDHTPKLKIHFSHALWPLYGSTPL